MDEILPIGLDFETKAFAGWRAPVPVGLAITYPDKPSEYLSWGHPVGNTHTLAKAKEILNHIWNLKGTHVVCHNTKFDTGVALAHMEVGHRDPLTIHDTLFLAYLVNPHARSLSLKPLAEEHLGVPPSEQDNLRDWVIANCKGANKKNFGAFISETPVDICQPYAIGDTDRTVGLYKELMGQVKARGMFGAYQREQKLMPIIQGMEQRGIRCNTEMLEEDTEQYNTTFVLVDNKIRELLGADINIGSPEELAYALIESGNADENLFLRTPKKQEISVSKDSLEAAVTNRELLGMLKYRGALETLLSTFMRPWLEHASEDGRLHASYNQVRGEEKYGTRTGRLSSDHPNMQNVAKELKVSAPDGYPPLPLMRNYLLPEEGHKWLKRDYSQQELRVLAHFEDGELLARYQGKPSMDVHVLVQQMINDITGVQLERKHTKNMNFGVIYGMGQQALSKALGCTVPEYKKLMEAYYGALPGVLKLSTDIKKRGRAGVALRTWGGREYYVEPPKEINGRYRTFEYKLLNYLIQGSSADITKEALIRYDNEFKTHGTILTTVHDEINISAPPKFAKYEMRRLEEAMSSIELDVQLLSDGFMADSWGECND